MNIKDIGKEVKEQISTDIVKQVIETDLQIRGKGKKYKCFLHTNDSLTMSWFEKGKCFKCFSCGGNYGIIDHYMQYKNLTYNESIKAIIRDFKLNIELEGIKTDRKAKKQPAKCPAANNDVYNYLRLRGISETTVDKIGIKTGKDGATFEYRNELGDHVANKKRLYNPVDPKRKMEFQKDTNINTLFNMDKVNVNNVLYITEGEIDCLSLIECGINNAVSVPTGCSSQEWVKVCWDWLEQFNEMILWFDNDEAGKKGVREISNRLPGLVKIINNDLCNDINEMLVIHGPEKVLEYSTKFASIENIADWTMIEDYNVFKAEKIKSGFTELDSYIQGFVFPSLNIITGTNGSGKSTMVNQMCIAESINQGYKTFVYSGELMINQFRYWLESTIASENHLEVRQTIDGTKYSQVMRAGSNCIREWLKDKIYFYEKEDVTGEQLIKKIVEVAKREGVRVFVIDNLLTLDLECTDRDEYYKQKEFAKKLKDFAIKYNAIVHLVAHPRKLLGKKLTKDDVAGSGSLTNLAHYVLGIHREQEQDKTHDAEILLLKDRHTGTSYKEINLMFSKKRRRFYRNEIQLNYEYKYATENMIEVDEQTDIWG